MSGTIPDERETYNPQAESTLLKGFVHLRFSQLIVDRQMLCIAVDARCGAVTLELLHQRAPMLEEGCFGHERRFTFRMTLINIIRLAAAIDR